MPVLAGKGPGDAAENLPGTDVWRAAELQISPLGEMQGGDRNLLECPCSLCQGRSADEAIDSLGSLFSQLCWGRDAASAPAAATSPARALAGLLDFSLNIYWTFGLMPIT